MGKRIKGIYKDTAPIDVPEGFYRHANNANLNLDIGGITSEEGNKILASSGLSTSFLPIGNINIDEDKTIIFSCDDSGNSEIGVLDNEVYTKLFDDGDITTGTLNLSLNNPINGILRINNKSENVIYWTDGLNPPRYLNIDNLPSVTNVEELNIFTYIGSPLNVSLNTVNLFGGNLVSGMYQFAVAYVDVDGNRSNFTSIVNPISIHRFISGGDNPLLDGFYEGSEPGTLTSKSISLSIDNIDDRFRGIVIAVFHYSEGTLVSSELLPEINIPEGETSIDYTYSGSESTIDISQEEIVINNVYYETASHIAQQDGIMYMGDLTSDVDIGYQRYANNIEVRRVEKTTSPFDEGFTVDIPLNQFNNKSYQREQAYAFYISLVLNNGQETYGYHIPGRPSEDNELVEVDDGSADPNEVIFHDEVDNTAKIFHYLAKPGSNGMAYWENLQETYPNTDDFDVYDVNGSGIGAIHATKTSLKGQKVRHHRFPEAIYSPPLSDFAVFDTLGIRFKNIKIPLSIKDKVKGFKIYYAKITDSNRMTLGYAPIIPQTNSAGHYFNDLPSVNDSGNITTNAFASHPFELMNGIKSVAQIRYIKNYCTAGGGQFFKPSGVASTNGYVAPLRQKTILDYDDSNRLRAIEAISHIPSNIDSVSLTPLGFLIDKKSTKEESQILFELDSNLSDTFDTNIGGTDSKYSWITSFHTYKKELYNSFDQQELIWSGVLETDMDSYDPSHASWDDGTKATGDITINDDAPPIINEVAATATTDVTNGATADGNIQFTYDGNSVLIAVLSGDSTSDVATKVRDGINADGTITLTCAVNVNTLDFFADTPGTVENGKDVVFADSGATMVTVSDATATMSGGVDGQSGTEGTIDINIGGTQEVLYSVQYGDTKEEIATAIDTYINANSTDYVSDITSPLNTVNIEAVNVGFDDSLIEDNSSTSSVTFTATNMSGGDDPGGSVDNYGGDVFMTGYGYRVTAESGETKMMVDTFIESKDHIYRMYSGDAFAQLSGTNPNNWGDILDYEEDDAETNEVWYDNYIAYDVSFSKGGDLKSAIPYLKNLQQANEFPTRVIRSQSQDNTTFLDTFRTFLENDFLDFPRNRGRITNIAVLDNILLIHMERGLFRTKGREELTTGDFRAFLGSGDIFAITPDEIINSTVGFGGTKSKEAALEFEGGYFFVDELAKEVYLFSQSISSISENGMKHFFNDNLTWFIDEVQSHNDIPFVKIHADYDGDYNRVILTKIDYEPTDALITLLAGAGSFNSSTGKFNDGTSDIEYSNTTYFTDKSFTLSYMPEIKAWISFHDYKPLFYCSTINKLYSYNLGDERFYLHNSKDFSSTDYCNFYGTQYSLHIQIVDNRSPEITKHLVNIEYETYTLDDDTGKPDWDKNFERFRIRNDIQDSDIQDIIYFTQVNGNARKVEETWRINKFRDLIDPSTGNINVSLPWHQQKRFIGKYVLIDLYYDTPDKVKMTLISARANFKESIR